MQTKFRNQEFDGYEYELMVEVKYDFEIEATASAVRKVVLSKVKVNVQDIEHEKKLANLYVVAVA